MHPNKNAAIAAYKLEHENCYTQHQKPDDCPILIAENLFKEAACGIKDLEVVKYVLRKFRFSVDKPLTPHIKIAVLRKIVLDNNITMLQYIVSNFNLTLPTFQMLKTSIIAVDFGHLYIRCCDAKITCCIGGCTFPLKQARDYFSFHYCGKTYRKIMIYLQNIIDNLTVIENLKVANMRLPQKRKRFGTTQVMGRNRVPGYKKSEVPENLKNRESLNNLEKSELHKHILFNYMV